MRVCLACGISVQETPTCVHFRNVFDLEPDLCAFCASHPEISCIHARRPPGPGCTECTGTSGTSGTSGEGSPQDGEHERGECIADIQRKMFIALRKCLRLVQYPPGYARVDELWTWCPSLRTSLRLGTL
eukprot:s1590_g32.t1